MALISVGPLEDSVLEGSYNKYLCTSCLPEASVASPVDLTQIDAGKLSLNWFECHETRYNGIKGDDLTWSLNDNTGDYSCYCTFAIPGPRNSQLLEWHKCVLNAPVRWPVQIVEEYLLLIASAKLCQVRMKAWDASA